MSKFVSSKFSDDFMPAKFDLLASLLQHIQNRSENEVWFKKKNEKAIAKAFPQWTNQADCTIF